MSFRSVEEPERVNCELGEKEGSTPGSMLKGLVRVDPKFTRGVWYHRHWNHLRFPLIKTDTAFHFGGRKRIWRPDELISILRWQTLLVSWKRTGAKMPK